MYQLKTRQAQDRTEKRGLGHSIKMEGSQVVDENVPNSGTTYLLSLTLFLTKVASVVENTLKVLLVLESFHKNL